MVHPHLSCEANLFTSFGNVFLTGLTVYTPFYLATFLLGPWGSPLSLLLDILRSCSFAASYGVLGWVGVCGTYRSFPGMTREKILYHSWISGLALFIEPPKRRSNLTLYVMAFFVDCLWNTFHTETRLGRYLKLPTRLMLLISSSLLFHQNKNSKFMKWLFGI